MFYIFVGFILPMLLMGTKNLDLKLKLIAYAYLLSILCLIFIIF